MNNKIEIIIIAIFTVVLNFFIVYTAYKIILENKKALNLENKKPYIVKDKSNRIHFKKLNFFREKINSNLILPSNIKTFIPFADALFLILACFFIYIIGIVLIYSKLKYFPASFIIAVVPGFIPVFILDIMGKRNSERVRKNLAEFVSVLARWCTVKEDIFFAFKKSIESGIGEPLRSMVKDMIIKIECGIDPIRSLESFSSKVNNKLFKDFVLNIRQNIKYRGNLIILLTNLEEQFYRMEEEYNKRKISTYKDRVVLYVVMIAVLLISWVFIGSSNKIYIFYIQTATGKILLFIFSVMYLCGLYTMLKIESFKEG